MRRKQNINLPTGASGRFRLVGGTVLDDRDWYGTIGDDETVTLSTPAQTTEGRTFLIECIGSSSGATLARAEGSTINGSAQDFTIAAGRLVIAVFDGVDDWRVRDISGGGGGPTPPS